MSLKRMMPARHCTHAAAQYSLGLMQHRWARRAKQHRLGDVAAETALPAYARSTGTNQGLGAALSLVGRSRRRSFPMQPSGLMPNRRAREAAQTGGQSIRDNLQRRNGTRTLHSLDSFGPLTAQPTHLKREPAIGSEHVHNLHLLDRD